MESGDTFDLCDLLCDIVENRGTIVSYDDLGVGYLYPSFVSGDIEAYERAQRRLIQIAQDNYPV